MARPSNTARPSNSGSRQSETLLQGEMMAEGGGPTITDLFICGYDQVVFEKDELNPTKDVINARMSWKATQNDEGIQQEVLDCIQYVPDPPCIMPFEEEEQFDMELRDDEVPTQQYWKDWANWIEKWPKIKEYKESIDSFTHLWMNRVYDSRMRCYVAMCRNSLGVRLNPGLDNEVMTPKTVLPGMCVGIENQVERNGKMYYKLPGPGAGWVLGTHNSEPVMVEAKFVELIPSDASWYRIISDQHVEIRKYPSYDDEARSGWVLAPKEVVVVKLKCKVNGVGFYLLADGRGWVFELKPGVAKNNKDVQNLIMLPCEDEFVEGEDAAILKNLVLPTNEVVEVGMWTYIVNVQPVMAIGGSRCGQMLTPGDVVKVDKRANANGNPPGQSGPGVQNRRWLRVGGIKAWVPETNEEGSKLMLEQLNDEVAYPSWFRPGKDVNQVKESWMSGLF